MFNWWFGFELINTISFYAFLLSSDKRGVRFSTFELFAVRILNKLLCSDAPGRSAYFQEHLKTITYAKFGGQTECIRGNTMMVTGRGLDITRTSYKLSVNM